MGTRLCPPQLQVGVRPKDPGQEAAPSPLARVQGVGRALLSFESDDALCLPVSVLGAGEKQIEQFPALLILVVYQG